jgi:ATP-dependent helicase/nuclease subunit A
MKRAFDLTQAQRRALDAGRNIVVTASAGSGKTATLVERFIELLRQDQRISPRHILAITFTQKAAAEMRQRLAERLKEAIPTCQPGERQRLAQAYAELPSARISTIHAFCASLLREYPVLAGVDPAFSVLEEIDSRRLRRQALDHTLETLASRPDDDADKIHLARLLAEWGRRYLEGVLELCLTQEPTAAPWLKRYATAPVQTIIDDWQEHLDRLQEPARQALLAQGALLAPLAELARLQPRRNAAKDSAAKLIDPVRPALQAVLAAPTSDTAAEALPILAKALTTAKGTPYSSGRTGSKANWAAADLADFRQALVLAGELLAPYWEQLLHHLAKRDYRAAELLQALAPLALAVQKRYSALKGGGAKLDFDELQQRSLALLQDPSNGVVDRLGTQIRYVMVDEFQDTDALQWGLIRPLVAPQGNLAPDRLFIVGDPKQSIYAFRQADVAVFNAVKEEILAANRANGSPELPFTDDDGQDIPSPLEAQLGDLQLAENFRTLPAPIAFVNCIFPRFMYAVASEPFQVEYDPLVCMRHGDTSSGSVEMLLVPPPEDDEETTKDNSAKNDSAKNDSAKNNNPKNNSTKEENDSEGILQEAELLARRLVLLLQGNDLQISDGGQMRPPHPGDIAILLRRRRNLPFYETALRRAGVPFQVAGGLGYYQRQEIYDLANILRLLQDPRDAVALLGALRSPYIGLSDEAILAIGRAPGLDLCQRFNTFDAQDPLLGDEDRHVLVDARQRLLRWHQMRDRYELVDLLHVLLEDSGAWGFHAAGERGAQTVANLEKFMQLARDFSAAGAAPLADFNDHLEALITQEEREGEAAVGGEAAVHLLTVHASKGLEFPVVALPDCGSSFIRGDSDPILIDPDLGLGLNVLDPENSYRRSPSLVRGLIQSLNRRKGLAEAKRLFYVAATRARDHLILGGRLRPDHLEAGSFDKCTDFLAWTCRALELGPESLEQGSTGFCADGKTYPLKIWTNPQALPVSLRDNAPESAADPEKDLLQAITPAPQAAALLQSLRPLAPVPDKKTFSATQIVAFERDPASFERNALGLDDGVLLNYSTTPDQDHRRLGMLFGRLAHAALENLARCPDEPDAERIGRLVRQAPLGREQAAALTQRLLDLVIACRRRLGTPSQTAVEVPFLLEIDGAVLNGVVDRIDLDPDGTRSLIDYKTGLNTDATAHRRQMQIYALFLQRRYPGQDTYAATVYHTAFEKSHTFRFRSDDLSQALSEIEELVRRMSALLPD